MAQRVENSLLINLAAFVVVDRFDPGRLLRIVACMLNNRLSVLTNTFMTILTLGFILPEATGFPHKLQAPAGNEKTRHIALLPGSNAEAAAAINHTTDNPDNSEVRA
jgi:hypothetical protein